MLLLQDDDGTCGLRVERAGSVLNGVGDEFFDAGIRNGGLIRHLIECTAVLDRSEEGLCVCHYGL